MFDKIVLCAKILYVKQSFNILDNFLLLKVLILSDNVLTLPSFMVNAECVFFQTPL